MIQFSTQQRSIRLAQTVTLMRKSFETAPVESSIIKECPSYWADLTYDWVAVYEDEAAVTFYHSGCVLIPVKSRRFEKEIFSKEYCLA
jgi:hypothetical protein